MGKAILVAIIAATVINALKRPWVGILAYYLLALLGPQYIWWWSFDGLRVSLWVAVFTLLGTGLNVLQKQCDPQFLLNRMNLYVLLLWCLIATSYFFGPFVSSYHSGGITPDQLFSMSNNIFLFYFCAVLSVNDVKKLKYLAFILVIAAAYLIYWANSQYLAGNWSQFNFGRLMGPRSMDGGAIYGDENTFAMLFVSGIPFLYFMGFTIERKWLRYAMWALIPLGWHAIFLTASRGGLLGLGVITLLMVLMSKRRYLAWPMLVVFLVFYQWQAGSVMKQRGQTISNYEEDSAAETRIIAWKGGLRMIEDHPITGVGLGSFITALPLYIESKPRVAHNTLVQFGAESGIGAAACYFFIAWNFFLGSRRVATCCRQRQDSDRFRLVKHINDASTVSFAGLISCSLFLTLNYYEIFYYLLLINNGLASVCLRIEQEETEPITAGELQVSCVAASGGSWSLQSRHL